MKKLFLTTLILLAIGVTSCVKDDPYVEPEAPEIPNSELKDKLVLNEINGSKDDADKYIELYNNSDTEIDLNGISIFYNNVSSDPAITWTGKAGDKIAARTFKVLKGTKGIGDLSTGLSGSQGINVEIRDAGNQGIDQFRVPAEEGRSNTYARIPDGTGAWYYDAPSGTEGASNGNTTTGKRPIGGDVVAPALVINEIDGNGKFVEIYNNTNGELSLEGLTLHKNGSGTWWTGSAGTKIAAKGYYTIAQTGETPEGAIEQTGASGISPKQCLKFELKDSKGSLLDEFVRTKDGAAFGDSCTPDYGKGTAYSFSRCPDGTGGFGLAVPSCNKANPATSAGAIVVD